ncbi:MAG: ArsR/SmtB family transcription factor [Thermoplasmata archaeon]
MNEERFLKCIVDTNRRRILTVLGNDEKCVNDLVGRTKMEQSLVSHHLRSLRDCGLVKSRKEGKKVMYRVSSAEIVDLLERIKDFSSTIVELAGKGECD